MPKLERLMGALVSDEPRSWRNVQVVALRRIDEIAPPIDYVLAARAIEKGLLRVTETSESGQVQTLRAENLGEVPVLLLDGEELRGAKQNRILDCDVLLRPHGKAALPVSCVEQGRWRYQRADFVPGAYSPARLRARTSRAVRESLRARGVPQADQGEVWGDVEELLRAAAVESDTTAMADAAVELGDEVKTLATALPWPADALGVAVYLEDRLAGIDVFDRPDTLRDVWPRLLGGYALDAITGRLPAGPPRDPSATDRLLTEVEECECEVFPSVDMGEDWRVQGPAFTGSALVFKEQALHVSVFPAPPGESDTSSASRTRIAGPSRRRRRRDARP